MPGASSLPVFHADLNHTGIFDGVGEGEPDPGNELIWRSSANGEIKSAPAVWNGTVYAIGISGGLYAFNATNGQNEWINYNVGGSTYSHPMVWNGTVYSGSATNSKIYAVNASSGETAWEYTAGGVFQSSPAIWNGTVYAGSYDANIYALNASSGDFIWKYHGNNRFYESSPAVWNGTVYVGSRDGTVYALNASSGTKIWDCSIGSFPSSPAIWNKSLFIGSNDNKIYALNALSGTKIWEYTTGGYARYSSPAIWNGTVYVGDIDDKIYALNALSGTKIWEYTTGSDVCSSPFVSNGTVYVGSTDSRMYALDAVNGQKIWDYTAMSDVRSSPVVWKSKVYFGSGSKVYALGAAPALTGSVPGSTTPPKLVSATISGTNLLPVTSTKLSRGGTDIEGTNLTVSDNAVTCDFSVPVTAEAGLWDISVLHGGETELLKTLSNTFEVKKLFVELTSNSTAGEIPLNVQFNVTGTGVPVALNLSFGDGGWHNTTSFETINVTHTYTTEGAFTATLNASYGSGVYNESSVSIIPGGVVANLDANPAGGAAPLRVAFNVTGTGVPVALNLSFGDGEWHNTTSYATINTTHTYDVDGTYTATLNASFGLGVYRESTKNINVNTGENPDPAPATGTPSGNGGGNSDSSAGAAENLKTGETVDIHMNDERTAVSDIVVTVDEDVPNLLMVTEKVRNLPSSVEPVDADLYQYVEINAFRADPSAIGSAVIKFSVSKTWLSENGYNVQDIILERYTDGAWTGLPTTVTGIEGGYVYYEAVTPGFSIFAIVYRMDGAEYVPKETALPENTAQEINAEETVPASSSDGSIKNTGIPTSYLIIGALAVILIISITFVLHRRRMKKYPDWWWDKK